MKTLARFGVAWLFHGAAMLIAIIIAVTTPGLLGQTLLPGVSVESVLSHSNGLTMAIFLILSAFRHEKGMISDLIANIFWVVVGIMLLVSAFNGVGLFKHLWAWFIWMPIWQAIALVGGAIIGQKTAERSWAGVPGS